MARRYFGTDGVRGIAGESLTPDLVERLGRAAALWAGRGAAFVGRDTRGSGPELEAAFARGVASAGSDAVLGGVLPTPAVALQRLDLGAVVSASHNPPEYNGVKLFDRAGRKPADAAEERIESLLDAPPAAAGGSVERVDGASARYAEHVAAAFGSDLTRLRIAVDCANGAMSHIAPAVFRSLGADVVAIGDEPDGTNINVGCGATDLALLRRTVRAGTFDLGIALDGDGDRILAVDAAGEVVDGDQILAVLALHLGVGAVVVTSMTNLGFHRLMADQGIRVLTTDVGDRYVLEALHAEGALLGGEQSGHVIYLDGHVTGDGLAAGLLLCRALAGATLAEAAAVMPKFPQAKESVPVRRKEIPPDLLAEAERLAGDGTRVLVRPSGTEPVVRVLAEAPTAAEAERLCGSIAALVQRELG